MPVHQSTQNPRAAGRKERDRTRRRMDILAAAERIFAARGFHEASIESIAQEAGYASGTIYLYFEDKDALYAALFAHKVSAMVGHVESEAGKTEEPLDGLERAVRAQFEFHDQNREFFELLFRQRQASSAGKSAQWKTVRESYERHIGILQQRIERAQKRKLVRKLDSRRLALLLLGMVAQMTREAMRAGGSEPLGNATGFVIEVFLHGVKRDS
jgi:AcrR family transcriptional regulator